MSYMLTRMTINRDISVESVSTARAMVHLRGTIWKIAGWRSAGERGPRWEASAQVRHLQLHTLVTCVSGSCDQQSRCGRSC